ncbi:MAG: hypothetical protein M1816_003147 [Peltula sp. TS41687]|nr:MAG: hypothetical protein M1816_003147 [Peltula sp. TS41687]
MAALHSALQALSPVEFSSVPLTDLKSYLIDHFARSQVLIDSVPIPPSSDSTPPTGRSRANTATSVASAASEVSSSSARSAPPIPEHAALQKEWGKPVKLSAKENPLGMTVYKLSAKDGKGTWFARRSVHEGVGFAKWRSALEREFPTSLEVQGAPGEGNIRGIGGERRIERVVVDGVGKMEVYHLSAQFPGPTTPRDFVTLLLTSPVALNHASDAKSAPSEHGEPNSDAQTIDHIPRHFMVISKPCMHPDCPPREGFVRGQYESVEFIREVASQTTASHPVQRNRANTASLARDSIIRNASRAHTFPVNLDQPQNAGVDRENAHLSLGTDNEVDNPTDGRKRGKTISFVEPGESQTTVDAAAELNPVEWIMITRSDPGGSVPRWMVERGTPASIVADASKFLDWACKLQESPVDEGQEEGIERPGMPGRELSRDLQALDMNGHLWGVNVKPEATKNVQQVQQSGDQVIVAVQGGEARSKVEAGNLAVPEATENTIQSGDKGVVHAQGGEARSTVESDLAAPGSQMDKSADDIEQHLPKSETIAPATGNGESIAEDPGSDSDTSTSDSFMTASSKEGGSVGDGNDKASVNNDTSSSHTAASTVAKDMASSSAAHEKERAKFHDRTRRLQEKLAAARSKILPAGIASSSDLPPKESAALAKAEERHRKAIEKQQQRYHNHVKKIETKREREERKKEEKRKKSEEKDEKARWGREREELKRQIEAFKSEIQALVGQIGELQSQNTLLAAKLGKNDPEALQYVLAETEALNKAVRGTDIAGSTNVV